MHEASPSSPAIPRGFPALLFSPRAPAAMILVFAFLLRLLLALSLKPVVRSDAMEYHEYAANLLEQGQYVIVNHGPQVAWHGMVMYSYRPPGYPFFLAGLYALVGVQPQAALLAQALLDSFTALLVFRLARAYLPWNPSLFVSFLYALHPFYVPMLMTEVLFELLFVLSLIHWTRLSEIKGLAAHALYGLGFGAAVLTRPAAIIFAPLAAAGLLWAGPGRRRKKRLAILFAWGMAAALVLGPWLIREYRVHHRFVFITSNGGRTFFDGNYLPVHATQVIVAGRRQNQDEVAIDRDFFNLTLQYLRQHPDHALRMMARRLGNLWTFDLPSEFRVLFLTPLLAQPGGLDSLIGGVVYFLFVISRVVMVGGLVGMIWMARAWRQWLIPYAVLILITAFHVFFYHGKPRYLSPFYPLLGMFFTAALLQARDRIRRRGPAG